MRILLGMGGKWNHCHRFDGNGSEDKKRTGVLMRISWEWEGSGITFTGSLEHYHLPLDWVHSCCWVMGDGKARKTRRRARGESKGQQ